MPGPHVHRSFRPTSRCMRPRWLPALAAFAAACLTGPVRADNIDVSTIPDRDSVQLTIYNSEDLTLVRETRHVTFRAGMNPIQFSWSNTLIDPTSVHLRFRTHEDDLDVLDTTFPHDRPQMLYWHVESAFDGEAVVEITYFTSGITWAADYVCVGEADEQTMSFEGYVKITNNSGEDYADAQVRLVVGTINLVEKVAELARRGLITEAEAVRYRANKQTIADFAGEARQELATAAARGMAGAPKEIVKEGLSEYFIFTVEGTETVPHSWSKRMRLFEGARVPIDTRYRYRPAEYGDQLVRLFIMTNDSASGLGSAPLPNGWVRLFRDNGADGLSYLTAYETKYVPIGDTIELNLGRDPLVVHERVRQRTWRDDFWFRDVKGNTYFSPDQGRRIRQNFPVAGWNDHERWSERVRNYRDRPVDVEIRRSFDGHVLFTGAPGAVPATTHDYRTVEMSRVVPSNQRADLTYQVTYRQGIHQKQNNVTIVDGE